MRHWGFAVKRPLEKTKRDMQQERKENMDWGEETSQNEEFLFLVRKHCDVYNFVTISQRICMRQRILQCHTKVDQYLWGAYLCSKENNCATNKHSMPFNLRKVDLNRKTEAVSPLCQVQAVHSPWVLISSLRNTKLWGLKRIRGRKFSLTIRVFKCLDRLISCSLY